MIIDYFINFVFCFFIICVGTVLLTITLLGQWSNSGNYKRFPPSDSTKFDTNLIIKTRNITELFNQAKLRSSKSLSNLTAKEVMQILYEITCSRFTHGDQAKYNLFSNWVQFFLGIIHPAFLYIRVPNILLRYGYSVLCSESSFVLVTLALKAGIPARHIKLNGHVVMEAWYDNNWHMYDPDLKVIPRNHSGEILSVEAFIANTSLVELHYIKKINDKLQLQSLLYCFNYSSINEIKYQRIGKQFTWKADVLMIIEKITQFLKYLLPLILIFIGTYILLMEN